MIKNPPLIRIADLSAIPRLSRAQLSVFENTLTGNICDALGGAGALDHHIKTITPDSPNLVGQALTIDCGPADILALKAGLTQVQAGDVIVQSTGGWTQCAAMGDMICGMAKNCGAIGVVTDGMVRDAGGIRALGIPVYARGITPNSPFANGPGTVGYPVNLGSVGIATGDIIVADIEGVVVIPLARLAEITKALAEVKAAEAILEDKVANGLKYGQDVIDLVNGPLTEKTSSKGTA